MKEKNLDDLFERVVAPLLIIVGLLTIFVGAFVIT
jgi:hypothetical protein